MMSSRRSHSYLQFPSSWFKISPFGKTFVLDRCSKCREPCNGARGGGKSGPGLSEVLCKKEEGGRGVCETPQSRLHATQLGLLLESVGSSSRYAGSGGTKQHPQEHNFCVETSFLWGRTPKTHKKWKPCCWIFAPRMENKGTIITCATPAL